MNKFLNKKKGPEAVNPSNDALNFLASSSPSSSGIKKSATSRWKKKRPVETKPELNIATALPSSDDFRTSLLLPNLSARFSMLREQDDPSSILGKASDDSVLQPRRRSRLNFAFGSNGLNDIAEVSSINSSVRPPYAMDRQESFTMDHGDASENDAQNGGMMSRARPGEGNTMFGGRQKVYKIPSNGANSARSLGKAVYEDDIVMSAFQKHKQREREAREAGGSNQSQGFDFGHERGDPDEHDDHAPLPNDSARDLSHSPSLSSYEKKLSTTSSTARSEARSSTAATSVASQPVTSAPSPHFTATQAPAAPSGPALKRADTKSRRLYEQGLDQHMYEQQTSALTRLNSIHRQRTLNSGKQSPPYLHSARSANNLHDRNLQPVYALRAQSPPPVAPLAPLTNFGSIRKPNSGTGSPITSGPQSPVSPQAFDLDEANVLSQALEPADRGKATAMGAFNKPAQQFDEHQYMERQRQLQRSQSNTGAKKRLFSASEFQQRLDEAQQLNRERSGSNASTRSRSRSASRKHGASEAYNVFQNAANQVQARPGAQPFDNSQLADTHRTFFGNISASDSEEDEDEQQRDQFNILPDYGSGGHRGWQPAILPSVSEHPALRANSSKASLAEEDEDLERKPLRPIPPSLSLRNDAITAEKDRIEEVDSPTLGPTSVEPLSGLVHHLRQKSAQSSIYPNDESQPMDKVPEMPEMPWNTKHLDNMNRPGRFTFDSDSRVESTYTNSNPWDLDDFDINPYNADGNTHHLSTNPFEGSKSRAQLETRVPSRANAPRERQSEISQTSEGATATNWQLELRKQPHNRDASTATQLERDAFANELAARRNAIQENMKSIVERETQTRGISPTPSATGAFKTFGVMRSKSSRESVDINRREPMAPPKAMKMLGIGASASSNALHSQYERNTSSVDVTRSRNNSGSKLPPLPTAQPRGPQPSDWEAVRTRGDSETSKPERQQPKSRSPASSHASGPRSRSNSEATTGRSLSRTGPYRDDLEKAMIEGTGSSAAGHPELSAIFPHETTPRRSPEVLQSQYDSQNRVRSNSRNGIASHYDAKNLQRIQAGPVPRPPPSGPMPATLPPYVYSLAGSAARPSPAASSYTQYPTPPVSGANTPHASTFSPPPPPAPVTQPRQGILRRKNIPKSEISEPTLVSSTSNIDTVDLPEGASLRNGMESPSLVPHINSRRRGNRKVWGLGRGESGEDRSNYGRSNTTDPWTSTIPEPDFPFELARTTRHHIEPRLNMIPKQGFDDRSTPPLQQYGFAAASGSPDSIQRSAVPPHSVAMEGGMF